MGHSDTQEGARFPDGDDAVDTAIVDALDRLAARREKVRDPKTGRWTVGNGGRLETGSRSVLFWQDLEPARAEIEERVKTQLALTDEGAPETALGLAGAYAEARLIRRSEFLQLTRLEDEPGNAKQRKARDDRRRRHMSNWAASFDRELRSALALGLERRTKMAPNVHELLETEP